MRARLEGARQMLAPPADAFDPTFPGLFAGEPRSAFVPLLEEMAADVCPASMRTALSVMAETDQRDLLPRVAVPTLLVWGERGSQLVVIPGAGHVSNLEQPEHFNDAVRTFCRAHSARSA